MTIEIDGQGSVADERLPEQEKAKEFYAKYEVKAILGR